MSLPCLDGRPIDAPRLTRGPGTSWRQAGALALLVLTLPSSAAAQVLASPRAAAAEVALAIDEHYFDPAAGRRVRLELETAVAAGAFDGITDARVLAETLTERLRPLDGHFRVDWRPAPARVVDAVSTPSPQRPSFRETARRINYGFSSARILPGNIGVLEVRRFIPIDFADPLTPARLSADAALSMVSDADAVIIDLRENGGGDPTMVGYLASAFLPANADVYNSFHARSGVSSEQPEQPHPSPRPDTPLFILVSARTASAAEAFAYTLQAAGRATVIGQVTAGAANPGGPVPLADGLSVFVPTGSPRNPLTRTNWEGRGVRPDIETGLDAAWTETYRRALLAASDRQPTAATRQEMNWVLESVDAAAAAPLLAEFTGAFGAMTVTEAGGEISIQDRRRPPWRLAPLGEDLFGDRADPTRRIRFLRDGGSIVALEVIDPYGSATRHSRRP